jgi:hypothetical protein
MDYESMHILQDIGFAQGSSWRMMQIRPYSVLTNVAGIFKTGGVERGDI